MTEYLEAAVTAARNAGALLRNHFGKPLEVNEVARHDIKLEIDVRTQDQITRELLGRFPAHALYGEEGIVGDQASEFQWVVDPLDGTVNFFYSVPHFCVSIALRQAGRIILGVIYDPMRDELWQVGEGEPARLNGEPCRVSRRTELSEAILSVGLSKTGTTIEAGLPLLQSFVRRARKCRMMGSAALDMAYVACGRLDAYIEPGVSLWDIAAGKILVENAGGRVEMTERTDFKNKYSVVASSGLLDLQP